MSWRKSKVLAVVWRDMREVHSSRVLAVLGVFGGLQCLLGLVSKVNGRTEDSFLVFMLGGVVGIAMGFDLIGREREHRTIDLLLVQGMSRLELFSSKWIVTVALCLAAAAAMALGGMAGAALSGKLLTLGDYLCEFGMAWWLLSVYGLLALLFSVLLRKGKSALIASMITWVMLRPMLIVNLTLGPLRDVFGWDSRQAWSLYAALPDFAYRIGLDAQRALPEGVTVWPALPYLALAACVAGFTLLGAWCFARQDEPTIS